MHCRWPVLVRMQQLLAGAVGEVTDGTFCDSILETGVDATEGELLIALLVGLLEGVVGKAAIVAMVVADDDAMLGGELLERSLGLD
jgi:hypothetical protein